MSYEVSSYFMVYHVYTPDDPKDVWGALGEGQPIVHQKISSDPTHGEFHPAFYEGDHQNHY